MNPDSFNENHDDWLYHTLTSDPLTPTRSAMDSHMVDAELARRLATDQKVVKRDSISSSLVQDVMSATLLSRIPDVWAASGTTTGGLGTSAIVKPSIKHLGRPKAKS